MLIKQKSPSLPKNLALGTFGELLIVCSTKISLLYLLCSMPRRYCLLHLIKQNCLLRTFLKTIILRLRYPAFYFRTNLKLYKISVTPNMVKEVLSNLDLSKASCPDYVPLMVLKNCEPELSYILTELFYMCLMEL